METSEDRYFQAIAQVASSLNSTLDRQDVLAAIVEGTARVMSAKACSLMLVSPDHRELHHAVAYGLSEGYLQKGPVSADWSLREAFLGQPVAILEAGRNPRVQYRPEAIREGIASILGVPLRLWDEVIGVMRVYTAETREFSPHDIAFAQAISDLAAIALANACRHGEVSDNYTTVRQELLEWYLVAATGDRSKLG